MLKNKLGDLPIRVQLRRTKGWRKPDNTVVVSRPSKWGNPYAGDSNCLDRARMTTLFRNLMARPEKADFIAAVKSDLRGKNLACWCPLNQPCHADVLLEIANQP